MNNTQKENQIIDDEVKLIDLILIISENIRLLVLGPLVIGAITFGTCYFLPKTFVSHATLSLPENNKNPVVLNAAHYISSRKVLEPVVKSLELAGNMPVDTLISHLTERLTVSKNKEGILQLEVKANNPREAQLLAQSIIAEWLKLTKPNNESKDELEKKLAQLEQELKIIKKIQNISDDSNRQLKSSIKSLDNINTLYIIKRQSDLLEEIINFQNELKGISQEVVTNPPSLPKSPTSPKKMTITIISILGTASLLLLFIFIRQSWLKALKNSENEAMQIKILNSLRLKN